MSVYSHAQGIEFANEMQQQATPGEHHSQRHVNEDY